MDPLGESHGDGHVEQQRTPLRAAGGRGPRRPPVRVSVTMNALSGQSLVAASSTGPAPGSDSTTNAVGRYRTAASSDRRADERSIDAAPEPAGGERQQQVDQQRLDHPARDPPDAVEDGVVRVRQRREEPDAAGEREQRPEALERRPVQRVEADRERDAPRSALVRTPRAHAYSDAVPDTVTTAVIAHSSAAGRNQRRECRSGDDESAQPRTSSAATLSRREVLRRAPWPSASRTRPA